MSRRKWLQRLVVTVVTACLLLFSGVTSAQGNSANAFERVKEVQERHTEAMMAREGVVGTAIGLDETGENVVLVLLESSDIRGVPADLEGVRVRPLVTGKIYALAKPPSSSGKPQKNQPPAAPTGLSATVVSASEIALQWTDNANNETGFRIERKTTGGFSQIATVGANVKTYSNTGLNPSTTYTYRVRAYNSAGASAYSNEASATTPSGGGNSPYPRPARIGISTGHPDITAGTIGCRVTKGGKFYALSNNHVYANENRASIGNNALQPGPYDGGQNPRDAIGQLSEFQEIYFDGSNNEIDAAIAECTAAMLDYQVPDGSYGAPSGNTADAYVGLYVKKHGRTTGLTHGQVAAINATVNVGYDSGTAKFVNQIIISPGRFSKGGDSGSLVVTEDGNQPVGLLFAGSVLYTIANPIDLVLSRFGVTVDDGH